MQWWCNSWKYNHTNEVIQPNFLLCHPTVYSFLSTGMYLLKVFVISSILKESEREKEQVSMLVIVFLKVVMSHPIKRRSAGVYEHMSALKRISRRATPPLKAKHVRSISQSLGMLMLILFSSQYSLLLLTNLQCHVTICRRVPDAALMLAGGLLGLGTRSENTTM